VELEGSRRSGVEEWDPYGDSNQTWRQFRNTMTTAIEKDRV
jgi:hypothetical protein